MNAPSRPDTIGVIEDVIGNLRSLRTSGVPTIHWMFLIAVEDKLSELLPEKGYERMFGYYGEVELSNASEWRERLVYDRSRREDDELPI